MNVKIPWKLIIMDLLLNKGKYLLKEKIPDGAGHRQSHILILKVHGQKRIQ